MSLSNQIIFGSAQSVKAALSAVTDVNYTDEYGYTPLIQAAIVNKPEIAGLILAAGADVNMADMTGRSALHWAVDNNNIKLATLLLEHKANPSGYTVASQPALAMPILRQQNEMKYLLMRFGADVAFAMDYINAKLLGHRYELRGYVDIVDDQGRFTELSYEGFILEFTLDVVRDSLADFKNNYAARHLEDEFGFVDAVVSALGHAAQLTRCQSYLTQVEAHQYELESVLAQDPLVIPIGQEGHAITFVRYGDVVALCDRAKQDDPGVPTVQIYRARAPRAFTVPALKSLVYERQTLAGVKSAMVELLGLTPVGQLDLPLQLMGNCAWANVEAAFPALVVLKLMVAEGAMSPTAAHVSQAKRLFSQWRLWDKERALHFCLQDFDSLSRARQASRVAMIATIFVQSCRASRSRDVERAKRLFPYLKKPGYEYVLQSYVQQYVSNKASPIGQNLQQLLSICDDFGEWEAE